MASPPPQPVSRETDLPPCLHLVYMRGAHAEEQHRLRSPSTHIHTHLLILVCSNRGEDCLWEAECLEGAPPGAERVICLHDMEARLVAVHRVKDSLEGKRDGAAHKGFTTGLPSGPALQPCSLGGKVLKEANGSFISSGRAARGHQASSRIFGSREALIVCLASAVCEWAETWTLSGLEVGHLVAKGQKTTLCWASLIPLSGRQMLVPRGTFLRKV